MIYRVILKVGYCDAFFEFEDAQEACKFAEVAIRHMVSNEDTKKKSYVSLEVVDPELEAKESEED